MSLVVKSAVWIGSSGCTAADQLPSRMTVIDALRPVADHAAAGRSCPFSAIGGLLGDGVQRPQSNALWTSFDDTEGRWGNRERHIEGGHRLDETFQCQAAEVFECGYFLYGCGDATGDQDLAILRLSTEPSGQVAHGADSGPRRPQTRPAAIDRLC